MGKNSPASQRREAYQKAIREADQGLKNFDYIGTLDRFRHRVSGELYKERALLNLHWRDIPNRMSNDEALYTTALGIHQYAGLSFIPGGSENVVSNEQLYLNTWQPSNITATPGDPQLFLEFVAFIFDGDQIAIDFFLDAVASLIQAPTRKWAFMILIVGGQGVGKSLLCEMIANLIGRRNTAFPTIEAIKGNFTAWLSSVQLVVVHELEKMSRDVGTRLKHWISSDLLLINGKNLPEFYIKNYANIVACSNHIDVAHLDADDRRIFSWVSQAQKRSPDYYANLCQWFFNGTGNAIVLDFFKNRDISGFNSNASPPKTAGREMLISNSRSEAENFLSDALESGAPPFACDLVTTSETLQYLRVHHIRCTHADVRRFLLQIGALSLGQCRVRGTRPNLWAIRTPEVWANATHDEITNAYVSAFDQHALLDDRTLQPSPHSMMPVRKSRHSSEKSDSQT